jgi:hypothetical protein
MWPIFQKNPYQERSEQVAGGKGGGAAEFEGNGA